MLVELKNNLSEIDRLALEIEEFCDQEQLPAKTSLELNLILEELVTNIISYGYDDQLPHLIRINLQREGDRLAVTVEDDGNAFNPLEVPAPRMSDNLDDLTPGGLGIHLARELTQEAVYNRTEGLNILTLIKQVPVGAA